MKVELSKREISVLMACLNSMSDEKIYQQLRCLEGIIKEQHISNYNDIDFLFICNIYNKLKDCYKK